MKKQLSLFPQITKEIENITKDAKEYFEKIPPFQGSEPELYSLEEMCKNCTKGKDDDCFIMHHFIIVGEHQDIKINNNMQLYCISHSDFDIIKEYKKINITFKKEIKNV